MTIMEVQPHGFATALRNTLERLNLSENQRAQAATILRGELMALKESAA